MDKPMKQSRESWLFAQELSAGPTGPTAPSLLKTDSTPERASKSGPYRDPHRKSVPWHRRVKKFFTSTGGRHIQIQQGPWDPYTIFDSNEEVKKFFNDFERPMGDDKLVYRENYAIWAIDEALKDFDPGQFQVTGQIMQNETVRHEVERGSKPLPKEVIDAIRADGQQDVDAEDPNPISRKDGELELVQSVGGAAQALISASPNSLGPPIQACATYLQMEKVGTYRESELNLWNSPLLPGVKIHDRKRNDEGRNNRMGRSTQRKRTPKPMPEAAPKVSKGFLDNQITAIVWILSRFLGELPKLKDHETSFEAENRKKLRGPKYGGAILADSMGLGKTLAVIATIELMASRGLNVDHDPESGMEYHSPILILCPNVTVASQWVEEIIQNTNPESIYKIIVSGGSSNHFPTDARIYHLNRTECKYWPESYNYVWQMEDRRASKTVIIMPIATWASRTTFRDDEDGDPTWHSRFTDEGRYFSVVCVDEAHKVKNASTKAFKSVSLLEREYTLLLTATPCLNTLTDLLGLARLLWTPAEKRLTSNLDTWSRIKEINTLRKLGILDTIEPYDDLQLAAARPSLLTRLLCKDRKGNGMRIEDTRQYLRFFESLAMLKRGPGSYIYEDWEKTKHVSLEGLFPAVDNRTVNIDLDQKLAARHQFAHVNLLIEYLMFLDELSSGTEKNNDQSGKFHQGIFTSSMTIHRKWQIASSSIDVFNIDSLFDMNGRGTKAEYITQMRNMGITFRELAEFLLGPYEETPATALGYLKVAIRGSPILRFILYDLKENILNRKRREKIKKLLITEATPILAYYYELVLQFIGINCRVFHADLSQDQRKELVASFNDDAPDSVQVLIQMYTVEFAGSNLHKNCSRVIIASQAHSLAVQWQAIHRVIRVGQTQGVTVFRLKVNNSYHAFRESRQIEKMLPELGARAQGGMNTILVQLLNLFQYEVEDAWSSGEGQQLVAEKSLLSRLTPQSTAPVTERTSTSVADFDQGVGPKEEETVQKPPKVEDDSVVVTKQESKYPDSDSHADKKRKLDNVKDEHVEDDGSEDEQVEDDGSEDEQVEDDGSEDEDVEDDDNEEEDGEDDGSEEVENAARKAFLALRPRDSYYVEFKSLPCRTRSLFDHGKNQLRRLLSFHLTDDDGLAPKVWTVEDLDNPAVLERALELMLRVRLGADQIEMLPFPHINFSEVDAALLERLQDLFAKVSVTAQDIDAEQALADAKRANEGLKQMIKGIDSDLSLSEIDEKFRDEVKHSSTYGVTRRMGQQKQKEEASDAEDDYVNPSSSMIRESSKAKAVNEKHDEDDEHAEGEEPDNICAGDDDNGDVDMSDAPSSKDRPSDIPAPQAGVKTEIIFTKSPRVEGQKGKTIKIEDGISGDEKNAIKSFRNKGLSSFNDLLDRKTTPAASSRESSLFSLNVAIKSEASTSSTNIDAGDIDNDGFVELGSRVTGRDAFGSTSPYNDALQYQGTRVKHESMVVVVDDDDDDIDVLDKEEADKQSELKESRSEMLSLQKRVADLERVMDAQTNQLMRNRIANNIEYLNKEIQLLKAQLNITDE